MYRVLITILTLAVFWGCRKQNKTMEGYAEVNGTSLYAKITGQGEPVMFIHGGPGFGFDYLLPQMEDLSDEFRLLFYDQRMTARSVNNVSLNEITFDNFVKDIEALRIHFSFEKINIVAHSWGSLLAVEYALRYPEHIDKIVLSNPVSLSKEFEPQEKEKREAVQGDAFLSRRSEIVNSEAFKNREKSAYENYYFLNFALSFHDTTKLKELNFNLKDDFFDKNNRLQYLRGLENYNYYVRLSEISAPVLVVRGEHDLTLREADVQTVDLLTNGRLAEFPNSGHFPFVEERSAYIDTLRKFLR